jgi:hypothetical protein
MHGEPQERARERTADDRTRGSAAAESVALMFLTTKIWDAAVDPVVGLIADRTETRWGKFRPYLLWFALPFGILGVLAFTTPGFGPTGRLVYAYATYTLLMMVYSSVAVCTEGRGGRGGCGAGVDPGGARLRREPGTNGKRARRHSPGHEHLSGRLRHPGDGAHVPVSARQVEDGPSRVGSDREAPAARRRLRKDARAAQLQSAESRQDRPARSTEQTSFWRSRR